MSPRRTELGARIAVIGAESPTGAFVRSLLEEAEVPGNRVELFGATGNKTLLSEYEGEARLIQELDTAGIASRNLVFLCDSDAGSSAVLESAAAKMVILDLSDAWRSKGGRGLAHTDLLPPEEGTSTGVITVPHYLSITLAELIEPLHRGPGIAEALFLVTRPASDFGKAGIEELREQTVNLLNFGDVPKEVFGRQLAFNCIPQHLVDGEESSLENRVSREVAELLESESDRFPVRMMTVPVFYGHGLLLRVSVEEETGRDEILEIISRGSGVVVSNGEGISTPLECPGQNATFVSSVTGDGRGAYWIWAVLDEAGAASARQALRLAESLCIL